METPDRNEEQDANPYEFKKANKALKNTSRQKSQKEDFSGVIKDVLTDAGISVLGGGFTSVILGRLSLPIGMLITGYGHYKKNNALRVLGIGIIASSSMANRIKNDPKASITENMSERIKAFAEELKAKLSLDLLSKQVMAKKQDSTEPLHGTNNKDVASKPATKAPVAQTAAPDATLFESPEEKCIKQQAADASKEQHTQNLIKELNKESEGTIAERLL